MVVRYINNLQDLCSKYSGFFAESPELGTIQSVYLCALAGNYLKGDKNALNVLARAVYESYQYCHNDPCLIGDCHNIEDSIDAHGLDALDNCTVRKDIYELITHMH